MDIAPGMSTKDYWHADRPDNLMPRSAILLLLLPELPDVALVEASPDTPECWNARPYGPHIFQ